MHNMLFNPKKSGTSIKWKHAVGYSLIYRIWGEWGGGQLFSVFARPVLFLWDVKWKEHADTGHVTRILLKQKQRG